MTTTTKAARKSGRSRLQIEARRREREIVRALGADIRNQRLDSRVAQAALARHAEISQGEVSRIEAGQTTATIGTLAALSVAMGGRLVVRIEPGNGMPIRDHIQSRMLEALLRQLSPRWKRFVEVPAYRPVRGVIDLVLHDVEAGMVVAVEIHSQLRRLEQQLRWVNAKAEALLGARICRSSGPTSRYPASPAFLSSARPPPPATWRTRFPNCSARPTRPQRPPGSRP